MRTPDTEGLDLFAARLLTSWVGQPSNWLTPWGSWRQPTSQQLDYWKDKNVCVCPLPRTPVNEVHLRLDKTGGAAPSASDWRVPASPASRVNKSPSNPDTVEGSMCVRMMSEIFDNLILCSTQNLRSYRQRQTVWVVRPASSTLYLCVFSPAFTKNL